MWSNDKGGQSHGVAASLGISFGMIIYSIVTSFGVAEILRTTPFAFSLIKGRGVGYLFYLAYQGFASKSIDFSVVDHQKFSKDFFKTF